MLAVSHNRSGTGRVRTTPSTMVDPKSMIGLEIRPLNEKLRQQAEKELRETPEVRQAGIEALRALLKADPKLNFKDDDEFLIRFLRPTKFYPDSAYALMQRVAEFKEKNGWLLDNISTEGEKDAITLNNVVNVLAGRDHLGRRVLFVNAGETWDPKKVSADQMFKLFYLVHLGAIMEEETQVAGVVVIMDFLGLSMKQVAGFSPSFSMRLLSFIQDASPLRIKEVHIVNQPFLFNMVFQMFKPFIREKLKSRMFFHGKKMESLHKHLDPSHLPKDYNGALPKMNYSSKDWYPVLTDIKDSIAEWNTMCVVKAKK